MLETLALRCVKPHPSNPREIDTEHAKQLSESMGEYGLREPILVRPIGDDAYQIVSGHHRWAAAIMLQWADIKAEVQVMTDEEAAFHLVDANLQRKNLDDMEEARAIHFMMTEFGWTQERVAQRFKRSQFWVSYRLNLIKAHPAVQRAVIERHISATQAAEISKAAADVQPALANKVKEAGYTTRQTEALVKVANNPAIPQDVKLAAITDAKMTPAHAEAIAQVKSAITRGGLIADVSKGRLTPEETQREVAATIRAAETPRSVTGERAKRHMEVHGTLVRVMDLLDGIDQADVYGLDGPALVTVEATLQNIGARLNKLGQVAATAQSKPASQRQQGKGKLYSFPSGAH